MNTGDRLTVQPSVRGWDGKSPGSGGFPDRAGDGSFQKPTSDQFRHIKPRHTRRRIRLTRHAVQRWCQRVEQCDQVDDGELGQLRLAEFVAHAHRRSRPRHWTDVEAVPGLSFLYWAEHPDVCALVINNAVVTVLARVRAMGAPRVPYQSDILQ